MSSELCSHSVEIGVNIIKIVDGKGDRVVKRKEGGTEGVKKREMAA